MQTPLPAAVYLCWIPLGAGGHCVRFSGRLFEDILAALGHRPRCDLYHGALVVELCGDRWTIELAPSPDADERGRGVVGTGAVGSRHAGWMRLFRYEVRCWRGGSIPDLAAAVGTPCWLSSDARVARRLLDLAGTVPTPVWGRDELRAGEMWNSNSMTAWLIAAAGLPTAQLLPPPHGRAPGWDAGLEVALRAGSADDGAHDQPDDEQQDQQEQHLHRADVERHGEGLLRRPAVTRTIGAAGGPGGGQVSGLPPTDGGSHRSATATIANGRA